MIQKSCKLDALVLFFDGACNVNKTFQTYLGLVSILLRFEALNFYENIFSFSSLLIKINSIFKGNWSSCGSSQYYEVKSVITYFLAIVGSVELCEVALATKLLAEGNTLSAFQNHGKPAQTWHFCVKSALVYPGPLDECQCTGYNDPSCSGGNFSELHLQSFYNLLLNEHFLDTPWKINKKLN